MIATKAYGRMLPGPYGAGLSRKAIFAEIDNSLRRLGMDYVDPYQIHRFDHDAAAKPTISAPIVGATKLHHLDGALASVGVPLSADEIAVLEEPYFPRAVVGFCLTSVSWL